MVRGFLLIALCACSQRATPTPTPTCIQEPPVSWYRDRYKQLRVAGQAGATTVTPQAASSFPSAALQRVCNADPIVAPICYEGASRSYSEAIMLALAADEARGVELAAAAERTLSAVEPRWDAIHCRGLTSNPPGTTPAQRARYLASLSPRCARFAAEKPARVLPHPETAVPCTKDLPWSATCRDEIVRFYRAFPWQAECEAIRASFRDAVSVCAFSAGRTLGNYFPGEFELAASLCAGSERRACLSGIAFVAAYLYPDRLHRALRLSTALDPSERDAFMSGLGTALSWRDRSDPELLASWLQELPPPLARLATEVRDEARRCRVGDFGDGPECRWPQPSRVSGCGP